MKSLFPTIIFLIVLTGISALFVFLFMRYGLGLTVAALGALLIVAGLFGFIFFLSIDPGYGWSKGVNFNANYVVISVSIFVGLIGITVYSIGKKIHETAYKTKSEELRCQDMLGGQVESIVSKEWYQLNDTDMAEPLKAYLFQERVNPERFKVVVINSSDNSDQKVVEIKISSDSIDAPIVVQQKKGRCSGVFESDLTINRLQLAKQNKDTHVEFDVTVNSYETGGSRAVGRSSLHLSQ